MREFLFIWLGSEMPEKYKGYIKRNLELMQSGDIATLLVDMPQNIEGLNEVKAEVLKEDEYLLDCVTRDIIEIEGYNQYTALSDFYRFYYASLKRHSVLYMDCDLVLNKLPEPSNLPVFGDHKYGTVSVCLFESNGCRSFFRQFLEKTKRCRRDFGLFFGYLNHLIDRESYGSIPFSDYIHDGDYDA